jgi:integrase/recombinase XerD
MAHARRLTPDEFQVARTCITNHAPYRDEACLHLSGRLGLRAVETAQLTVDDVCDARGNISSQMWIRKSKGGSQRRVVLPPDVQDVLRRHMDHSHIRSGRLFRTVNGVPMTRHAIGMVFRRIFQRAGLVGASSHSGRRTLATNAARLVRRTGQSLSAVSALIGHANESSTFVYLDPADSHVALIAAMFPSQCAASVSLPALTAFSERAAAQLGTQAP